MNSKDVKIQRAAQAQFLKLTSGLTDKTIAAQLNVSTKTIARDLRVELPAEMQSAIDEVSAEFREAFISKAQPLTMRLLDRLEEQVEADELKPRDLGVCLGILLDKIRAMQPQPTTVTETKKFRITYTTPDGKSGTLLDGITMPGELPEAKQ